jgi:hypothetical protein
MALKPAYGSLDVPETMGNAEPSQSISKSYYRSGATRGALRRCYVPPVPYRITVLGRRLGAVPLLYDSVTINLEGLALRLRNASVRYVRRVGTVPVEYAGDDECAMVSSSDIFAAASWASTQPASPLHHSVATWDPATGPAGLLDQRYIIMIGNQSVVSKAIL